jgi:sugar phosphate isomerase/epimerase
MSLGIWYLAFGIWHLAFGIWHLAFGYPLLMLTTTAANRPVTLFTGQWADLPLATLAAKARAFGFDGLELACWGDHFDVSKALADKGYCQTRHDLLAKHRLKCWAISNHLVGQAVSDPAHLIDHRHKSILPKHVWGNGDGAGVNARAAKEMINTARAAARLGVGIVNGFTGSPVWHMLYFFPPTSQKDIDKGFATFAKQWKPILDVFKKENIKFALEVHPTEIAYDIPTAQRALDALDGHPAFQFNFDPSHLVWQGIDPVQFIHTFPDRIAHVHMKDVQVRQNGTQSILGGHLSFGDATTHGGRAWDFRSVGRGDVDFDAIVRALNRTGYRGPLSVEWEDPGMDREHGATESCAHVRATDFAPAIGAFDAAFAKK